MKGDYFNETEDRYLIKIGRHGGIKMAKKMRIMSQRPLNAETPK